jgi:hypothetical protein
MSSWSLVERMMSKLAACCASTLSALSCVLMNPVAPSVAASARLRSECEMANRGAERLGELHTQVAQPADTHDADLLAGPGAVVRQRRVHRHAGAQQRRGDLGRDAVRDAPRSPGAW